MESTFLFEVHYSEECLRQLRDALKAGFKIHIDSVLLPENLGSRVRIHVIQGITATMMNLF